MFFKPLALFFFLIAISSLLAKEELPDTKTVSKVMGHLISRNLKNSAIPIDTEAFLEGIRESFAGKQAPLPEQEALQLVSQFQEKAIATLASKNLKEAEEFLKKNINNKEVQEIEAGKLQYLISKKGKGNSVKATDTPLLRYTGKYLNGTVFGETLEPEKISLPETIPGFRNAIVGMQEGEIRTIYIHPTLGYGNEGFLQPNSLLTYEVELLQANFSENNITLPENLKDKLISDGPDLKNPIKEEKAKR